jgi:OOP family OmpA-OmpF porin
VGFAVLPLGAAAADMIPGYINHGDGVLMGASGYCVKDGMFKSGQERLGCGGDVDSDGDGVPDSKDKCPNTPKGVKVDEVGCPLDSDGDGVPDYLDRCPLTPKGARVDADGCPLDTDGDGVPDYRDKCPDTPRGAKVDSDGCIEHVVLKNVLFKFDKSTLTAEAQRTLDAIARDLAGRSGVRRVAISGHTDSIGSDAYNQKLSERRAKSVASYLKAKGVEGGKLASKGYGESQPVASNKTKEGRAENRRVEITVEH